MRFFAVSVLLAALSLSSADAPLLSFKAAAKDATFTAALSKDLTLRVDRSAGAGGAAIGWELSVEDKRVKDSPNFLYECLCGHGPFPSDVMAWTVRDAKMAERVLHVYGYPFDLRVKFTGVKISGPGPDAVYTDGTIEIQSVALAKANPKQTKTPR